MEDEIKELNEQVKCKLAPSPIHGIGVFALRDIKKGEKLYCIPSPQPKPYSVPFDRFSEILEPIREYLLSGWPAIMNGSKFLSSNDWVWMIAFMNHSDNPNYYSLLDCAARDIKKGEEITENYREMPNYEKIYPWIK